MSQFKKRDILSRETLGHFLKRRRESLKFKLPDVAKELKVSTEFLEALEAGQYQNLPHDVYVKGFLGSYTKLLGLSSERVLSVFKRERSLQSNLSHIKDKKNDKHKFNYNNNVIITPKVLAVAGFAVLSLLLFFYIAHQFFSFLRPPKLVVTSPKESELKIESGGSIYIEGSTDAGVDAYINNFQIKVGADGTFGETVSLKEGVNVIEVKAISKLNKESVVTKKIQTSSAPEVLKNFQNGANLVNGVEVTVEMGSERSSVEIWIDDKAVYGGKGSIFEPGIKRNYKASRSIKIKAGNAGNTSLVISNQKAIDRDLGVLGKPGQVVTVEFKSDQKF